MNNVNIELGNGGLGRDITNNDIISGLVLYTNLNSQGDFDAAGITGLTAINRIGHYFSLEQFELETGITFNNAATEEIWYQVKEYDRSAKKGFNLFIGLFYDTNNDPTPVNVDYSEIKDLQVFANGTIRQVGVYQASTIEVSTANIETIDAIATELFNLHMPLNVIYGADTSDLALTALPDLRNLSAPAKNVSTVILQDGDNYGSQLAITLSHSIPAVGLALGVTSTAKVNESIAWVQQFNLSGSGEMNEPAFGDGTLVKDVIGSTIDGINDKGYIFGRKYVGDTGTYFNDNHSNDLITSDYAYMSEVRTIYKAVREVRIVLLPYLNSPIKIDASKGTIDKLVITNWTNKVNNSLNKMAQDNEISAYKTYIDPNQNVLLTSTVYITIKIVPFGTAREIDVTIGYTATL